MGKGFSPFFPPSTFSNPATPRATGSPGNGRRNRKGNNGLEKFGAFRERLLGSKREGLEGKNHNSSAVIFLLEDLQYPRAESKWARPLSY
jgi:uncharacterized MAPEG superfamily protein